MVALVAPNKAFPPEHTLARNKPSQSFLYGNFIVDLSLNVTIDILVLLTLLFPLLFSLYCILQLAKLGIFPPAVTQRSSVKVD